MGAKKNCACGLAMEDDWQQRDACTTCVHKATASCRTTAEGQQQATPKATPVEKCSVPNRQPTVKTAMGMEACRAAAERGCPSGWLASDRVGPQVLHGMQQRFGSTGLCSSPT